MGANDDTVTRGDFFVRVDGRVERAGMLALGRLLAEAIPGQGVRRTGGVGVAGGAAGPREGGTSLAVWEALKAARGGGSSFGAAAWRGSA